MGMEWLIEPLDTLFFRDGQPFGMGDGGWLESIFPPTPQTMQGIVRSKVLQLYCKDLDAFRKGKCKSCEKCEVKGAIGSPEEGDLGRLEIRGPYLVKDGTRYYPTPLDLVRDKANESNIYALVPSEKAIQCDLGMMRFPALPDCETVEPVSGWICEEALNAYLDSTTAPNAGQMLDDDEFFKRESRVGLKRDHASHHAVDGMLYSISPLRFHENVRIGMRVEGIDELVTKDYFAMKIGGEGRPCRVEVKSAKDPAQKDTLTGNIKLVLMQPADLGGEWRLANWPDGLGNLDSACTGRPFKIGGWDLKANGPKPMRSCVPAGSVYYFKGGTSAAAREGTIGGNKAMGFGHYRLGRW